MMVATGCGGGASGKGDGAFTSGDSVAYALEQQLLDSSGEPIANASCPNERLTVGEDVGCRVTFDDGTFKDIVASVKAV